MLLSTENDDGSPNLAPMSSAWALGWTVGLGIAADRQTAHNLPGPGHWEAVERLAPLTGRTPVPESKPGFRHERAKFEAAGLTPEPSRLVRPPRVAECPLQLEARSLTVQSDTSGQFLIVEAAVLAVHADPRVVVPDTEHVDPAVWSFRSETAGTVERLDGLGNRR